MSTIDISRRLEPAVLQESTVATPVATPQPVARSVAVTLVAADLASSLLSAATAMCLPLDGASVTPDGRASLGMFAGPALLFSVLLILFCHIQKLYDRTHTRTAFDETASVLKAAGLAILVLSASLFFLGVGAVSQVALLGFLTMSITSMVCWRQLRYWRRSKRLAAGRDGRNIVIVGPGKTARQIEQHLASNRQFGCIPKGIIATEEELSGPVLGRVEDLPDIVHTHFIDEVFVVLPAERELVMQLVIQCREAGVQVRLLPDLCDGLAWPRSIEYVGPFPAIAIQQEALAGYEPVFKRWVDILGSGCALVLCSPLLLLIALAIRLDSPGPILYRSQRVGKKGRQFTCYKCRTMVNNAELLRASLQNLNGRDRVLFKIANDPRVTRLGRLLRKYSLDELPQLWNVLKGEMSLVGPRPATSGEVAQYESTQLKRLKVMPGITGLWQVEARCDPSFESYINLDNRYIDHWSLWLDLKILLKTIPVVLGGSGQ